MLEIFERSAASAVEPPATQTIGLAADAARSDILCSNVKPFMGKSFCRQKARPGASVNCQHNGLMTFGTPSVQTRTRSAPASTTAADGFAGHLRHPTPADWTIA